MTAVKRALRLKGHRFHYRVLTKAEREVSNGKKYEVTSNYYVDLGSLFPFGAPTFDIPGAGAMAANGIMLVRKGFRWDGPSGPAIDTADFMRGSCVHDLLYLAMRWGAISTGWRDEADAAMRAVNRTDGMWPPRAWWTFWAVRLFGGYAARGKR